jgi:lactate permease
MSVLLSALPIILILFLMIGLRWGAARAGAAGYLCGLAISVLFFGATPVLLAYAHAKALLYSLDVLLIIWAAFLLYRVVDEAGAIRKISGALNRLTPDTLLQTLIIGWIFASFLQGVGGFGVPVAVTAPLLTGVGISPLLAVVLPSIGHGWAVTFGSMGSSFQALITATGQPAELLAPPAALFLGLSCPIIGLMVAHISGGRTELQRLILPVLVWGAVMGSVQYLVVVSGLWTIGAFLGSMAGLIITPLLIRIVASRDGAVHLRSGEITIRKEPATQKDPLLSSANDPDPSAQIRFRDNLLIALSGYAILIVITLAVQLIPAIKNHLSQLAIQLQFPEIVSAHGFITPAGAGRKISYLIHPGSLLIYTSILAYWVYLRNGLYQPGSPRRILSDTLVRVIPSSVSILSMISMALIMEHTGMTETLARALAVGTGSLFPLFSPWIGAIGAFMTGSNTNSNVVFGALQMQTAKLLGFSIPVILAAQTSGAALASVAAPAKIVVGASTVGMTGKEGDVLRRLALYVVGLILIISLLTWIGTH